MLILDMDNAESCYIPKHNPTKPRGEDAHFICRKEQVIGVADGVGGWAKEGIDSGNYARELMRNAVNFVNHSHPAAVDPKSVLLDAFQKTAAPGSSTALIITLNGNLLRAANMGDSGFLVIRGGKTVYRSPVQQHNFNHPYQLGNASFSDRPAEAGEIEVQVESGDIIVVGTDGLFDNMFPEEVEATVGRCLEDLNPRIALKLATAAHRNSLESDTVSPFQVAAKKTGVKHKGGKPDDITVIVTWVKG